MTDLVFSRSSGIHPPVTLDFIASDSVFLNFEASTVSSTPPIVLDFLPNAQTVSTEASLALTTEDISAEFIAISANNAFILDLTTDDVTTDLSVVYDVNVHRLTLSSTCALSESTAATIHKNKAIQDQTAPSGLTIHARQDDTQRKITKQRVNYSKTQPTKTDLAVVSEHTSSLYLSLHADVNATLMLFSVKRLYSEQASSLFIGTCAGFDILTFTLTERCAMMQFMGDNLINYIQSYYPEPLSPYTPSADFIVVGSPPYSDQTNNILRYKPDSTLVFSDLMPIGQPVTLDFQVQGIPQYDHITRVYDEPLNPYTPTTIFTGQESSIIIDAINNTQAGVMRTGICFTSQRGTSFYKNKCSSVEDASRPPPGTSKWIDNPRPPIITPPDQTQTVIPIQDSYIMQHIITAELLDATPVNLSDINISLDADSFSYTFSATLLDKTQVALLKQTGAEPVQVVLTIDGVSFNMLVEKISRGVQFAKNTITISGRSLSALLGAPYQQQTSATQGSLLTIQQIADLQLPIGWTINWSMPTWLVPAGAYTHSNATPIQAIKQIAENIGAVVIPHKTIKQLTIQPRYPVLPWNFAGATPDIIVPDAAITELTERPAIPEQANGVYIHGNEIGGAIGFCRLNGTAGDKLAQTESNQLMTDATALRALGERVLAANQVQPILDEITLPFDNALFPLIEVGKFIEIGYEGSTVRGIVNSTSLTASLTSVRQSIKLGEDTTNSWTQFKNLLPADPMLLATLSSTDGVTSLMTMLDSGVVRVRGTGVVNNKYYIKSGRIDGDAPNMAQSVIVI